jgi:hypothetical protein
MGAKRAPPAWCHIWINSPFSSAAKAPAVSRTLSAFVLTGNNDTGDTAVHSLEVVLDVELAVKGVFD